MNIRIRQMAAGLLSLLILVFGMMTITYAGASVIFLEKDAKKFSKIEQDLDFRNMEPGEKRMAVISLTNLSENQMDFYLNGEIVYNIADAAKTNKNAIYELSLTKGNEKEPYFIGWFGSEENTRIDTRQMLQRLAQNVQIATLKQGEKETITMTLLLDGASTGNEYMNTEGIIRLNIGTSPKAEETFDNQVSTGDQKPVWSMLLLAAGALIVFFIIFYWGMRVNKTKKDQ